MVAHSVRGVKSGPKPQQRETRIEVRRGRCFMIHIEKEGLPQNVKEKIIRLSKSNEWKLVPDDDAKAIRHFFNDVFPKEDVKRVLVHEQHGICAYCMRRIHEDAHTRGNIFTH